MAAQVLDLLTHWESVQCCGTSLLDGVAPLTLVIGAEPAPEFKSISFFTAAKVLSLAVHRVGEL